jgi:cellulose synthase/poly-beta-1,6-N-acetylglucosamine synthase-like glycosyltransferase
MRFFWNKPHGRHRHDGAMPPIAALISTKNPTGAIMSTVTSLIEGGAAKVIVVNDGSDAPESLAILGCLYGNPNVSVVHMPRNGGKAAALRAGYGYVPRGWMIVQTDDDTIAGNLAAPATMLATGKTDIADIRIEVARTRSLLGAIQELDYWLINAIVKRYQNLLRSRLWMSGASVMYTYAAGRVLLCEQASSITEDTEGLFRARKAGFRVRYCPGTTFYTMVPERLPDLRRQWQRWSLGNGQVIGLYGLGGGNMRIATVNLASWLYLVVLPVPAAILGGVAQTLFWLAVYGVLIGIAGAIAMQRPKLALVGLFIPLVSAYWAYHACEGLVRAARNPRQVRMTWASPSDPKGYRIGLSLARRITDALRAAGYLSDGVDLSYRDRRGS